jgi:MFS family permease
VQRELTESFIMVHTSPASAASAPPAGVGRAQWLTLVAALLGWMFDGAEMGVFSLVGRRAMTDLLAAHGTPPGEATIQLWFGVVTAGFLVGAATGGVLFGWLGDRVGRVRAMTLSVLTYAVFTGLCGLSTAAWQMATLRFVAALGMGGEWSLGVALVMEVWPNRSRAFMAGLIGAAANVGYLLVAVVSLGLVAMLADVEGALRDVRFPDEWTAALVANQGWRLLMILGTAPALLTFLIRLFVPESERWRREQQSGATSNWATRDLLGVLVGAVGPGAIIYLWATDQPSAVRAVGTLLGLGLAIGGYTYPVIRYLQRLDAAGRENVRQEPTRLQQCVAEEMPRHTWQTAIGRMLLGAALSGVALLGTWGLTQWVPNWADKLNTDPRIRAKEFAQIASSAGAIVGTILAAMAGDWLGRRRVYSLLCIGSLASVWLLVLGNPAYGAGFLAATFFVGFCTASFYGWLPLYLPELFHTNVRATGQGFSFNFGRILAAVGVLQTANLLSWLKDDATVATVFGDVTIRGGFPLACVAMSTVYFVGLAIVRLAPETKGQPLPD